MSETTDHVIDELPLAAASSEETTGENEMSEREQRFREIIVAHLVRHGSFEDDAPAQLQAFLDELVRPNPVLATLIEKLELQPDEVLSDLALQIVESIYDQDDNPPSTFFESPEARVVMRIIADDADAIAAAWNGMPVCRVCGCTQYHACDGGCEWVDDPEGKGPLCSQCLETMQAGEADEATAEPITDEELRRSRPKEPRETEMKNFMENLSAERIQELEHEKSTHVDKWIELEEEKANIVAEYGGRIKAEKGRVLKLKATLDAGREDVAVRCQWMYDWTNGIRELVRLDTNELVDSKRIPYDELERWRAAQEPQLPFDGDTNGEAMTLPLSSKVQCNVCGWVQELGEKVSEVPQAIDCPGDGCDSRSFSLVQDAIPTAEFEDQNENASTGDAVADQMAAIADAAHAEDLHDTSPEEPEATEAGATGMTDSVASVAQDASEEGGAAQEPGEEESAASAARKRGRPRRVA